MKASFKYFFCQYYWLFVLALLIPIGCIFGYCIVYRESNLDEAIWATIISGGISYIGTIAWGIFIYYDSWQRRKEQEYRDKPRIRAGCINKDTEQAAFTYEDICGRPLCQSEKTTDNFFYFKVRMINHGNHTIFNIKPCLVLVYFRQLGGDVEQEPRHYVNLSTEIVSFKESCDLYVGVLKSLVGSDAKTIETAITYVFRFQDDLMNTYYCRCVMPITKGKKQFADNLYLYTEEEYDSLMRKYKQIKDTCKCPYSRVFGLLDNLL